MKRQEILNPMVFKTPQPKQNLPSSPVKQNGDNADDQINEQNLRVRVEKHLENITPLLYKQGIGKDQYMLYINYVPQFDSGLTVDDHQIYKNQMIKWGSYGLKRLLEMHVEHTKELLVSNTQNSSHHEISLKFYSSYTLAVSKANESKVDAID